MIIVTTAVVMFGFGLWSAYMIHRTRKQMQATADQVTIAEQSKEITRLRAQVAMIIGKEPE